MTYFYRINKKNIPAIIIRYFVIILLLSTPALAKIINVPADKITIQAAIDYSVNRDTILVSPGTYQESINFNGKRITLASHFLISGDTSFISGTIIKGNYSSNNIIFSHGEDSTTVLCGFTIIQGYLGIYCENSSPVLRNLVIANNKGGWGGGIYCRKSNCMFTDLVISGNINTGDIGGGIYFDQSNAVLRNVLIENNKVLSSIGAGTGGGGISCWQFSTVYLSNVTIRNNSAKVCGGGIYIDYNSTVTFDSVNRCNIYFNEAQVGSDIYSEMPVKVIVDTFTVKYPKDQGWPINNFTWDILHAKISQSLSILYVSPDGSNQNTGASWNEPLKTIAYAKSIISDSTNATIFLAPGTYSTKTNGEMYPLDWRSNISLIGSGVNETILMGDNTAGILFMDNVSGAVIKNLTITQGDYGLGGGIYCNSSSPEIVNVIISNCRALQGGAINCSFGARPALTNVLLYNNVAENWGGALYAYHAGYILTNVTMVNNKSLQYGGAVYFQASALEGQNCILWNNTPQQIYFYDMDSPSSVTLSYSLMQDGRKGIWENNNGYVSLEEGTILDRDPKFVKSESNNFHLNDNSPCIGSGKPTVNSLHEDIEGNERSVLPDSVVDIGAYENLLRFPSQSLLLPHFIADKTSGYPPLETKFVNYTRSSLPVTAYEWDFDSDGAIDSHDKNPVWIFSKQGLYSVKLKVHNELTSDSLILKDFISVFSKGVLWVSSDGSDSGNGSITNPYMSITRGIKAANAGDTVIVEPGTYNENINFEGKNITVGSKYLLTNDTSNIPTTIIRGKVGDAVVKFENYENNNAQLIGLTVENGNGNQRGGGISIRTASPVLKYLIIRNNSSMEFGGGIGISNNSNPLLSDLIITNNHSRSGGGISILGNECHPRIVRTLIYRNSAEFSNALIMVMGTLEIINCTITGNTGSDYGLCSEFSSTLILNSILWNNGKYEMLYRDGKLDFVHSDMKGGEGGVTRDATPVNGKPTFTNVINLDPQFNSAALNDYSLTEASPCIDGGTEFFVWNNEVVINYSNHSFSGKKPDIGALEYNSQKINPVEDNKNPSSEFKLLQNYPNPFNPTTKVGFRIADFGFVSLKVYDILGNEVAILVNEVKAPGEYEVQFDGSKLASGVYFYNLVSGEKHLTSKMNLLK